MELSSHFWKVFEGLLGGGSAETRGWPFIDTPKSTAELQSECDPAAGEHWRSKFEGVRLSSQHVALYKYIYIL